MNSLPFDPSPSSNHSSSPFASTASSQAEVETIQTPTHTDVLLGRGVATNRHPGNENFRSIVAQHVGVYVTSTKKQKMMISRSIVDKVKKALVPPGRFLEKDPETDLWSEVGDKKALEKTAQALRDGAAPLRKQMSEDFSDPNFLAAVFDHGNGAGGTLGASKPKGHRRMASAPVVRPLPLDIRLSSDAKRSKPNSPVQQSPDDINYTNINVQHLVKNLLDSGNVDAATAAAAAGFPSPSINGSPMNFGQQQQTQRPTSPSGAIAKTTVNSTVVTVPLGVILARTVAFQTYPRRI
eukprot:g2788.t1 g2788   contig12:802202-803301(-)